MFSYYGTKIKEFFDVVSLSSVYLFSDNVSRSPRQCVCDALGQGAAVVGGAEVLLGPEAVQHPVLAPVKDDDLGGGGAGDGVAAVGGLRRENRSFFTISETENLWSIKLLAWLQTSSPKQS